MSSNLIDITTIVAVESIFAEGPKDPWGASVAGRLADIFVYSDEVRYVLPMPPNLSSSDYPGRPSLLLELEEASKGIVIPEKYSTETVSKLEDQYLLSAFDLFYIWAKVNPIRLSEWANLHSMEWVRDGHTSRVGRMYVYNVELLHQERDVDHLSGAIQLTPEQLFYAFDVILRKPLYGLLAGETNYFASHPIRNIFKTPGSTSDSAPAPKVCVSFERSISKLAGKLSQSEYIKLLLELREVVRDQGLHLFDPGQVEKEAVRKIAKKVSLPPHLKDVAKSAGIAAGVIGGLGAIPILGPASALAGSAIAIATSVWSGELPRHVANWKWLDWALKWEIEDEI